jgi:menaquinone-specific isochorismate synthase
LNHSKPIISDFTDRASEDFHSFINKNEQNISDDSLLSFIYPINNTELIPKLSSINNKYDEFLFFEKFDESYSFIAIDCLIELSQNAQNIQSLEKEISELKYRINNNWSEHNINKIPIITGGIKFDPSKSSQEWSSFRNTHFFVPKMIVFRNKNKTFLVYNYLPKSNPIKENLLDEFTESVSSFLNLESEKQNKTNIAERNESNLVKEKSLWSNLVTEAKKKLDPDFKKIVLSRRIELTTKDELDWTNVFNNLETRFPNCYLFMLKSNGGTFFGASPEKFINVQNDRIEIDALAGSAAGDSKNVEIELLNKKNIKEHKYVIDFIRDAISNYVNDIQTDSNPQIKILKNVQHLYTKISANLTDKQNVLSLIDSMFPTPAVCGLPKKKAIETINKIETFDRGLFSGLIGWIDLEMNCEFAVAIRSALCKNKQLYLYAGAGIVEESIPEEEYIETEMKLNTILNLFDEQNKG